MSYLRLTVKTSCRPSCLSGPLNEECGKGMPIALNSKNTFFYLLWGGGGGGVSPK